MSWLDTISAMVVCAGRCPGLVDLGRLPSESEAPIAVQTRDYRQGHAQTQHPCSSCRPAFSWPSTTFAVQAFLMCPKVW